jgi:hypothetical protein
MSHFRIALFSDLTHNCCCLVLALKLSPPLPLYQNTQIRRNKGVAAIYSETKELMIFELRITNAERTGCYIYCFKLPGVNRTF